MKTKIDMALATVALSGSLLCSAGAVAEFDIVIYGSSPAAISAAVQGGKR